MNKIILGISGEMASGKTTITKYLQKNYKAATYRFSDILRDSLDRIHKDCSRENLQEMSTLLRIAFGEDALAKSIAQDVKKDSSKLIVIDGVRRLGDIEHLRRVEGFKLVYVDTKLEKCHQRIVIRNENSDDKGKTLEEFKKDRQREAEQQIKELKNVADINIYNDGSLEELYKQLDKIV